jgi:hypothetical protein
VSDDLKLVMVGDHAAEIHRVGGGMLLRYVYRPDTSVDESARPYVHPVNTLAGELLTNFRPNDHRWHHGLNFTINCLSGYNFWGGATYRPADGYQLRADHGTQQHTGWLQREANYLAHTLDWRVGADGERLLQERRELTVTILSSRDWSLRWNATLKNITGRTLQLGQYHSNQGLAGSHYSGLQFRGARELLDDHSDAAIGIFAEGGLSGEGAVHGTAVRWMEWHGQKDTSLRRVNVRFESNLGPFHCFVRRKNPLAALPFQYEHDLPLAAGASLNVDYTLTFTDA